MGEGHAAQHLPLQCCKSTSLYDSFNPGVSATVNAELVKLQLSANDWFVRKARRVLVERAAAKKLGDKALAPLDEVLGLAAQRGVEPRCR